MWGVWAIFIIAVSLMLFSDSSGFDESEQIKIFLSLVVLGTIPMILIFYATGPKPKWRWGKKQDDDPNLDW